MLRCLERQREHWVWGVEGGRGAGGSQGAQENSGGSAMIREHRKSEGGSIVKFVFPTEVDDSFLL